MRKRLPAEGKKHINTPWTSKKGVYTLTCMEQVACLSRRRTCTDKREQVVMPASIIQEVWRSRLTRVVIFPVSRKTCL